MFIKQVKVKIQQEDNTWIVQHKPCFSFRWKTITEDLETGAGTRPFPIRFNSVSDAISWIKENIFIEILVFREKSTLLKEQILLKPSSDKKVCQ